MARDFSKSTSNYLGLGGRPLIGLFAGDAANSIHAWVRPDSFTGGTAFESDVLTGQFNAGLAAWFTLLFNTTTANNRLTVFCRSVSTDSETAVGVGSVPTGQWSSVGAVMNYATDTVDLYLNGALDNSVSVSFNNSALTDGGGAGSNTDAIGAATAPPLSTIRQFDGRIAEVAMWSGDIGLAGYQALAGGKQARYVQPPNLGFYLPLDGARLKSHIGDVTGSIGGSVPVVEHPPLVRRRFWGGVSFAGAVSASGAITQTTAAAEQAATAAVTVQATAGSVLAATSSSATAKVTVRGTITSLTAAQIQAAVASAKVAGVAASETAPTEQAATAAVRVAATIEQTVAAMVQAAVVAGEVQYLSLAEAQVAGSQVMRGWAAGGATTLGQAAIAGSTRGTVRH